MNPTIIFLRLSLVCILFSAEVVLAAIECGRPMQFMGSSCSGGEETCLFPVTCKDIGKVLLLGSERLSSLVISYQNNSGKDEELTLENPSCNLASIVKHKCSDVNDRLKALNANFNADEGHFFAAPSKIILSNSARYCLAEGNTYTSAFLQRCSARLKAPNGGHVQPTIGDPPISPPANIDTAL